ncbi:hypothetical protein LTR27_001010 [Elasticomyces elasticus]|nr:hypothetical protein LTR27_001010 [Elasticomyces elasticus]
MAGSQIKDHGTHREDQVHIVLKTEPKMAPAGVTPHADGHDTSAEQTFIEAPSSEMADSPGKLIVRVHGDHFSICSTPQGLRIWALGTAKVQGEQRDFQLHYYVYDTESEEFKMKNQEMLQDADVDPRFIEFMNEGMSSKDAWDQDATELNVADLGKRAKLIKYVLRKLLKEDPKLSIRLTDDGTGNSMQAPDHVKLAEALQRLSDLSDGTSRRGKTANRNRHQHERLDSGSRAASEDNGSFLAADHPDGLTSTRQLRKRKQPVPHQQTTVHASPSAGATAPALHHTQQSTIIELGSDTDDEPVIISPPIQKIKRKANAVSSTIPNATQHKKMKVEDDEIVVHAASREQNAKGKTKKRELLELKLQASKAKREEADYRLQLRELDDD